MRLTEERLREIRPCGRGLDWYLALGETDLKTICHKLIDDSHGSWANWVLVRLMTKTQKIQYAIFAAEQVLHIHEAKYPDDQRPRKAIEAAREYLKDPTEKNRSAAAYAAADAAYAAADAAYAAADAADAAAYAADAAAYAADAAAYSDYTDYAAAAAADAAAYARKEMQLKIVNYGLELLGSEN